MPLTGDQESLLWAMIQKERANAGPLSVAVPGILAGVDKFIPTIPKGLREARVGDVLDAYVAWRRSGRL